MNIYNNLKLQYKAWEERRIVNAHISQTTYPQQSLNTKSIFIHIPRTAGSSMVKAGICEVYGHVGYDWYKNRSPELYSTFFKFAFIRNPWDRLVSAYFYLNQDNLNAMDTLWAKKNIKKFSYFEDFVLKWVNKNNINQYMHFIPQVKFICNEKLEMEMDFIGRFESINTDYAYIAKRLGLNPLLIKANESNRSSYRDYYNSKLISIVGDAYEDDIKVFGYDF